MTTTKQEEKAKPGNQKQEKITIVYGWDGKGSPHIVDDSQLNIVKDEEGWSI